MSGEKSDFNAMDNSLDFQNKPEGEACVWLEHCQTNLFGSPDISDAPELPDTPAFDTQNAPDMPNMPDAPEISHTPDIFALPAGAEAASGAEAGLEVEMERPDNEAEALSDYEPAAESEADYENEESENGEEAAIAPPLLAKPQKIKKPKEKLPHFPRLKVEPLAPPTLLSRLFDLLALLGPLVLAVFLLVQVALPLLEPRNLWLGGETVLADVLRGVINGSGSDWLILQANGEVYFDSPPLYFWFLTGIHALLNLPCLEFLCGGFADKVAAAVFVGSALSGLLLLGATLFMARNVANFDRRGQFASGVVLLGFFLFAGALHYGASDLFFCALVVTAQAFMFLGLRRSSSFLHIGLGFAFAALAFLAKGLPGLLLPLLCAVLFAFWQGRPWRLLGKDFLLGFLFSLLPVVLWVGVIWAEGHYEVVVRILVEQFAGAILQGWDYSGPWWYYLLLPLLLLPWVFLALFPNWGGLFSRESAQAIKEAFRGSHQGLAFVWLALLCAIGGFFLLSSKSPLDLLPLFPPLAIVAGRVMLGLSPLRNMLLQRILAVFFLVLALAFAVLPVYFSGRAESVLGWLGNLGLPVLGVDIGGVFIVSLALLAAGCLLLGPVNARRPESTLLVVLVLVAGIACPLSTLGAPSLGKLLSPAEKAQPLALYVKHGYTPYAYAMDGAPFAYYAGAPLPELPKLPESPEQPELVESPEQGAEGKLVLLTSRAAWTALSELFAQAGLQEAASFSLGGGDYVLLASQPLPEPGEERQLRPVLRGPALPPGLANGEAVDQNEAVVLEDLPEAAAEGAADEMEADPNPVPALAE